MKLCNKNKQLVLAAFVNDETQKRWCTIPLFRSGAVLLNVPSSSSDQQKVTQYILFVTLQHWISCFISLSCTTLHIAMAPRPEQTWMCSWAPASEQAKQAIPTEQCK
jgi:hypothetical protein